jgi:ketosteroid isomerase-like protein
MIRSVVAMLAAVLLSLSAEAQQVDANAEHDALRKLKDAATEAVNKRDYAAARAVLHEPFMATLVTQDSFTDFEKLKAYFEGLYTRDVLRMKSITMSADADDISQIYNGTFALTKGSTKERYELADGRNFDMNGRWTAVSIKEDGAWKVLAVHTGVNFMDNPVLAAIEKSVMWFGIGGGILGVLVGFAAGWFVKRSRA